MALQTPNFFDEFKRIRTHVQPYEPGKDYSLIIGQLTEACRENNYLGTSPQNLVEPAELLPVVVIRQEGRLRSFINPKIVAKKGKRLQYDACGNIFFMRDGKKAFPFFVIRRPRYVKLSYLSPAGRENQEWFFDPQRGKSRAQSLTGAICHEFEHLSGLLLIDNARERAVNLLAMLEEKSRENPEVKDELTAAAYSKMPFLLQREGDRYVLHHAHEYRHQVPEVSPDALFFDGVGMTSFNELTELKVPRGGKLLSIAFSELLT